MSSYLFPGDDRSMQNKWLIQAEWRPSFYNFLLNNSMCIAAEVRKITSDKNTENSLFKVAGGAWLHVSYGHSNIEKDFLVQKLRQTGCDEVWNILLNWSQLSVQNS